MPATERRLKPYASPGHGSTRQCAANHEAAEPVWHYTVRRRLESILTDGAIKPATAQIEDRERPVVWCSTNPNWEETANKAFKSAMGFIHPATRETTERFGAGLIRIQVNPEAVPVRWRDYVRDSGIRPKIARGLVRAAKKVGSSPRQWRMNYEPILASHWLGIETWDGHDWVPLTLRAGTDDRGPLRSPRGG